MRRSSKFFQIEYFLASPLLPGDCLAGFIKGLENLAGSRWAVLIKRVYEVNPLACPKCGQEMKIFAFIDKHNQYDVIERILPASAGPPWRKALWFMERTEDQSTQGPIKIGENMNPSKLTLDDIESAYEFIR